MWKRKKHTKNYEDFSLTNQKIIDNFKDYLQNKWKMGIGSKSLICLDDEFTFSLIWDRDELESFCVGYLCCLGASPTEANDIVKFAINNNFWLRQG